MNKCHIASIDVEADFDHTGVFVTLFVAHIIAAANDFDLIFRLIAAMITIQTLFAV